VGVIIAQAYGPDAGLSADEALARLMAGNERYVHNRQQRPNQSLARRRELTTGQRPFAVILGCSDSRVPPELVFDQGLGDLFVTRVAGNIAADTQLGSIEYAVAHLHTRLIVVLGHEKCGAVAAAVQGVMPLGNLRAVLLAIQPSVEATRSLAGDKVHNCVLANAQRVARQIRESDPVLRKLTQKEGVKVVAADYALDSGKVTLLGDTRP
jgi:carbonic anhydrase